MANEDVIGPRKTMFVLVIVVGCFAILWPRILSPLILGVNRDSLKPNQFDRDAAVKQERAPLRAGPHPAMRERGRAIPPAAPPAPRPAPLPAHIRPPPIPGMRPPLGNPGGPVAAPKSSMGFVMPIYTICIIIFFVYTLAKILFKRTGSTSYETIQPDAQFRRRVFRDDSRSSSDKLVVTAISGLVAEVQQQMQASYDQNQQRQEARDNARPHTNGTVIHTGPVKIVASEYVEPKDKKEQSSEPLREENGINHKGIDKSTFYEKDLKSDVVAGNEYVDGNVTEHIEKREIDNQEIVEKDIELDAPTQKEESPIKDIEIELLKSDEIENETKVTEDFLSKELEAEEDEKKQSTPDLLEEALQEDSPSREEADNGSVKVVGMELTMHSADGGEWPTSAPIAVTPAPPKPAHEPEDVKLIYLETDIPDQSRVLVTDFADQADRSNKWDSKNASLVVSGKMTLSLIQDAPRDTPEKELETTVDEFTTASAFTQDAEKDDSLSEEEIEEEIEVEEIEEEVEEVEEEAEVEEIEVDEEEIEEEEEQPKPKKK